MTARIERLVTSGTFNLDGESHDVDNNVWLVGDDNELVIIDAAHDADGIAAAADGRTVLGILCTHAHDDHIDVAPEVADYVQAPIWLHPDDVPVWELTHRDRLPDHDLADRQRIDVAGVTLEVLSTPGHTPGSCSFYIEELGTVFTGDTLFQGGPGATGRSFSSFPDILESIRAVLLTLPADTVVNTGHGDSTTIGDEAPHEQEWIDRGH